MGQSVVKVTATPKIRCRALWTLPIPRRLSLSQEPAAQGSTVVICWVQVFAAESSP